MVGKVSDANSLKDSPRGIHENNDSVACSLTSVAADNWSHVNGSGDNSVANGDALNATAVNAHVN